MDKRKEQQIEKVLKSALPDQAPENFTANIMHSLQLLSNEESL